MWPEGNQKDIVYCMRRNNISRRENMLTHLRVNELKMVKHVCLK